MRYRSVKLLGVSMQQAFGPNTHCGLFIQTETGTSFDCYELRYYFFENMGKASTYLNKINRYVSLPDAPIIEWFDARFGSSRVDYYLLINSTAKQRDFYIKIKDVCVSRKDRITVVRMNKILYE